MPAQHLHNERPCHLHGPARPTSNSESNLFVSLYVYIYIKQNPIVIYRTLFIAHRYAFNCNCNCPLRPWRRQAGRLKRSDSNQTPDLFSLPAASLPPPWIHHITSSMVPNACTPHRTPHSPYQSIQNPLGPDANLQCAVATTVQSQSKCLARFLKTH